jgi:hypothetical protein
MWGCGLRRCWTLGTAGARPRCADHGRRLRCVVREMGAGPGVTAVAKSRPGWVMARRVGDGPPGWAMARRVGDGPPGWAMARRGGRWIQPGTPPRHHVTAPLAATPACATGTAPPWNAATRHRLPPPAHRHRRLLRAGLRRNPDRRDQRNLVRQPGLVMPQLGRLHRAVGAARNRPRIPGRGHGRSRDAPGPGQAVQPGPRQLNRGSGVSVQPGPGPFNRGQDPAREHWPPRIIQSYSNDFLM